MEDGLIVFFFSICFAGVIMMLSYIDKDLVKNNKQTMQIIKLLEKEFHVTKH